MELQTEQMHTMRTSTHLGIGEDAPAPLGLYIKTINRPAGINLFLHTILI
jgi:hypothetical protein